MLDLISSDVLANEVKIHYYRTGGEKPPLVLPPNDGVLLKSRFRAAVAGPGS